MLSIPLNLEAVLDINHWTCCLTPGSSAGGCLAQPSTLTLGLAATFTIAAGSNVGADCSMSKCRKKF
jgi:hypothetical protein